MKRQVSLDTETTGKGEDGSVSGHRIVEVGCVEIIDRHITGRQLQFYVNPGRPVDPEAERVHGLTNAFLADKPPFAAIADELIAFIRGSELLIHNAKFDTAFLDDEWTRLGRRERTADLCTIVDTLALAMKYLPGHHVNLDSLCKKYGVDASGRQLHGALLDAQLLAEVYLQMTLTQQSLAFEVAEGVQHRWVRPPGARLPRVAVPDAERVMHVQQLMALADAHQVRPADPASGAAARMGCLWGPEFEHELLTCGAAESQGDFDKRCAEQREAQMQALFGADLPLRARMDEQLQNEYDAWQRQVLGEED